MDLKRGILAKLDFGFLQDYALGFFIIRVFIPLGQLEFFDE